MEKMYLDRHSEFDNIICKASEKYKFITILIEYASFSTLYDFDKLMVVCFTNEAINLDDIIPNEDCLYIVCNFKLKFFENDCKLNKVQLKNVIHFDLSDIKTCFINVIMQCAKLYVNVHSVYRFDLDLMLNKICE